jgi:phosphoglycolate phosphatase
MFRMTNPFEGIRAALFDMDGTLVETNIDFPLMKREMLALGERHGILASELQGLDILAVVDHVTYQLSKEEAKSVRQEAFDRLEQIELVHCQDAGPIDCAPELLKALEDAGIKVAVVTRNCRSAVRLSLEKAGIHSDVLLTRDDVTNTKPHPDHLHQALDMLGVTPEEAMMVGDHWMDIRAGKAAGTRTIGFLRPDRPKDFFDAEPPDLVVQDLAELLAFVKRLKI